MQRKIINKLIPVLTLFILIGFSVSAQKIHISKEKNGFWIIENGEKIFFFQRDLNDSIPTYARNNYLHPVFDLNGNCITEDYPSDHLHQRGIYWAWHQVLLNNKAICDPWELNNFTQKIENIEFSIAKNKNGIFSYTSFWETLDNTADPFLKEQTVITIHPKSKNYRQIDFSIKLLALENNLKIGGADNEKGYSGFSTRIKTNEGTVFTNRDNEIITPQNLPISAGQIIDISNSKEKFGITIISWPQNPDGKQWILRQSKNMQNCSWPGRIPVDISTLEPIVLKYTLLIHRGKRKKIPLYKIIQKINENQNLN